MTLDPFKDSEERVRRREDSFALDFAKVVDSPPDANHRVVVRVVTDIGEGGVELAGKPQPAFVTAATSGDISVPEEGDFVVVGYLRGRQMVVVGSAYTRLNRSPSYEVGERRIGNDSGSVRVRDSGVVAVDGPFGVVPKRTDDPSSPEDGSVWYRSDLDEYRGVENGNTVTFNTTTV